MFSRFFKKKPRLAVLKNLGDELVIYNGTTRAVFVLTSMSRSMDGVEVFFTEKAKLVLKNSWPS